MNPTLLCYKKTNVSHSHRSGYETIFLDSSEKSFATVYHIKRAISRFTRACLVILLDTKKEISGFSRNLFDFHRKKPLHSLEVCLVILFDTDNKFSGFSRNFVWMSLVFDSLFLVFRFIHRF